MSDISKLKGDKICGCEQRAQAQKPFVYQHDRQADNHRYDEPVFPARQALCGRLGARFDNWISSISEEANRQRTTTPLAPAGQTLARTISGSL